MTIVLATLIATPTTTPCIRGQPSRLPTPTVRAVIRKKPMGPPMRATRPASSSSPIENSTPTENRSSTTPISANRRKDAGSEIVGPGVKGPTRMPPRM